MSTINCPACGAENEDTQATCKNCGVNFARLAAGKQTTSPSPPQVETEAAKKNPVIGFAGMALMGLGICSALLGGNTLAMWMLGIGGIILAYALFTGNLSFLGRGK